MMLVCVLVNSYDVGVCVVQLFHLVNSRDPRRAEV
jgi:hypothetical protein